MRSGARAAAARKASSTLGGGCDGGQLGGAEPPEPGLRPVPGRRVGGPGPGFGLGLGLGLGGKVGHGVSQVRWRRFMPLSQRSGSVARAA
ncbi:hypothetical protein GCM10020254_65080 [Streptomyces goshikiensis]